MVGNRRRPEAIVLLAALAVLAGCSGPPPQSEVVCDHCVGGMTDAGNALNASVTVEESVTHVYLRESGDARFEARMRLDGSGVNKLRSDERLVDQFVKVVRNGGTRETRPAFDQKDLDGHMEGSEFVVTYRVADFADQRLGGTTFSDRFFRQDADGRPDENNYDEPYRFETDRLVVHGPEGTDPLIRPDGATTSDNRVVWEDDGVSTRTYLVFGTGGPGEEVLGRAVIALDVFGWAAPQAALGAAIPMFLLFFLAALLVVRYRTYLAESERWTPGDDVLFWVIIGGSATLLFGAVGAIVTLPLGGIALVASITVIGIAWWWLHDNTEDDATGVTDTVGPREATGGADSGPGTTPGAADTTHEPVGQTGDSWPEPSRRVLFAVVSTVAGVTVLTALFAADYSGLVVGELPVVAGVIPFPAFPALGYLVTKRDRAEITSAIVVLTSASPWLVAFPWVVDAGADQSIPQMMTFLWGMGAVFGGVLLFYAALWLASR